MRPVLAAIVITEGNLQTLQERALEGNHEAIPINRRARGWRLEQHRQLVSKDLILVVFILETSRPEDGLA
jgi:hypothetical protein